MKKVLSIIMMFLVWAIISNAQPTILAKWSFPNGTAVDSLPNQATTNNTTKALTTKGGTSAIDFTKNGATTKAAQATGWDNGKNTKYWQIEFNSTAFKNLALSSKLNTGSTNPGPRDFKTQYKVGLAGTWTDINSGNFKTANDWTTGALVGIALPAECNEQVSVFIRWIMTSDTANTGAIILSSGICKIDDITIAGDIATSINENNHIKAFQVYPNPSTGNITINKNAKETIEIYNPLGQKIFECLDINNQINVDLTNYGKGIYILKSGSSSLQKIIIR